MTTTILGRLTVAQRLTLAERLVSLIDAKEDHFFLPAMHTRTEQQRPLLEELEKAGYVYWDKPGHRIHRGPELEKPREQQDYEARRNALLKASPVGKKLLGLDQGTAPDARAGGMSPERRAALLSGSELGRAMMRNDDVAKNKGR